MKFGESLSEGIVPEWRKQYVDYKAGKKLIKKYVLLQRELQNEEVNYETPLLGVSNSADRLLPHFAKDAGADILPPQLPNEQRRQSIFLFSSSRNRGLSKEEASEETARFTAWLDGELEMVNAFYVENECEVYRRFLLLDNQIAQLKEHRAEHARRFQNAATTALTTTVNKNISRLAAWMLRVMDCVAKYELPSLPSAAFLGRIRPEAEQADSSAGTNRKGPFDPKYQENMVRNGELAFASEAETDLDGAVDPQAEFRATVPVPQTIEQLIVTNQRDYRTPQRFAVPYLYAKKTLKDALVEHYRSVTLVRSYRNMNHTAFRKITKKFDKVSGASISASFMRKVDNSYFQTSTFLDQIQGCVEDLYLAYFGSIHDSKKHGLEKLKSATLTMQPRLYHPVVFMSGIFLGFAFPLLGIVIYMFVELVKNQNKTNVKYLGQLWGGFLLIILMFLCVDINFYAYTAYKISYKFIFEFNLGTVLDYRQFLVLPSVALGIWGICTWFSFRDFWPDIFPGSDWPLVFLAVMLILFLWPGKQFYGSSRKWLQVALWRVLWSGFYPVEFRDFILGDILCSLGYSLSNFSFFICLYHDKWRNYLGSGPITDNTKYCGSRYSRSMGFLSALPSIWRFLQCLRRYLDTGNAFPHLANMLKYFFGCLYSCFLSLWRIDQHSHYEALFITVASVYSAFACVWDIVMDWSLMQPGAKYFLLRDDLFFEQPIYYYVVIVVDVILRFIWIVYIAFPGQLQQLAITSFGLAAAEVFRRFMWMFFRLENEHRTNVTLFRASRELPIPYNLSRKVEAAIDRLVSVRYKDAGVALEQSGVKAKLASSVFVRGKASSSPEELDVGVERPTNTKSTMQTISAALNKAHIKDFVKKKYATSGVDSDEEDVNDEEDSNEELTPVETSFSPSKW